MAVSRALRRLLRIRDLEEEQRRMELESAQGELNQLEGALESSFERGRLGRRLVETSAHTGQLTDRLAGIEETHTAERFVEVLEPRVESQQEEVNERRQAFLTKRIERRQAETLIEEASAREALEANRKAQQELDSWFGNQLYQRTLAEAEPRPAAAKNSSPAEASDETDSESSPTRVDRE